MDTIKIWFVEDDFEGNYKDPQDCPLARAIKRQLNPDWFTVGVYSAHVRVNGEITVYKIKNGITPNQLWWAKKLFGIFTYSKTLIKIK